MRSVQGTVPDRRVQPTPKPAQPHAAFTRCRLVAAPGEGQLQQHVVEQRRHLGRQERVAGRQRATAAAAAAAAAAVGAAAAAADWKGRTRTTRVMWASVCQRLCKPAVLRAGVTSRCLPMYAYICVCMRVPTGDAYTHTRAHRLLKQGAGLTVGGAGGVPCVLVGCGGGGGGARALQQLRHKRARTQAVVHLLLLGSRGGGGGGLPLLWAAAWWGYPRPHTHIRVCSYGSVDAAAWVWVRW